MLCTGNIWSGAKSIRSDGALLLPLIVSVFPAIQSANELYRVGCTPQGLGHALKKSKLRGSPSPHALESNADD
jgi:hypothetical protein